VLRWCSNSKSRVSEKSRVLDRQFSRGAEFDTDHYFAAAKLRERLQISKQIADIFDLERFILMKLSETEVWK